MQTDESEKQIKTFYFIKNMKAFLSEQENNTCLVYKLKKTCDIFNILTSNFDVWVKSNEYFTTRETFEKSVVVKCFQLQKEMESLNIENTKKYKKELLDLIDIILKECHCNIKVGDNYCKNKKTGDTYCTFHYNKKKKIVSHVKETTEMILYTDLHKIISEYISV